jgi:putative ABC transport system substrate-binding protein
MNKKLLIGIIIILVLAIGIGVYFYIMPKKTEKTYHVGVLSGLDYLADTTDGFKEKMTELGYVEGKNIVYDIQKTNVDLAVYESILNKFVADKVDLIFVFPTEATQQAKKVTQGTGIPVVFTNVFIEDTGIVNSVRQPGGNITGVRWVGPDLALERFEIMRELLPNAKRMFIPYLKNYPIVKSQLEALRPAFNAANIALVEVPAETPAELKAGLEKYKDSINSKTDAILTIAEPLGVTPDFFTVFAKFADEHKIPFGGAYMLLGKYEALFGLTPQGFPQGKQAAFLADKILRGTPAGTIPVVSAEAYFQLSYREAQKLGLSVQEGLLSKANEIIR